MKELGSIVLSLALMFTSCTSDKDIKADLTIKAKTDIGFAGVNYTVKNKIVVLTGVCPSLSSKQKVLQTVKTIGVIDGIIDSIRIAPVILNNDLPLKQNVDSVLAHHAEVTGRVESGVITLTGQATAKEMKELLPAIKALRPAALKNLIVTITGA